MEEVTRTFQDATAVAVENVGSPVRQGEPIGTEWGSVWSPPGRTQVVPDQEITPSYTAQTPTVTPTSAETLVADSPDISSGTRRALRKRKESIKPNTIDLGSVEDSEESDSFGSSPSVTTGTRTHTPTLGSPSTPVGTPTKFPKTWIVTRASEIKSKEKKAEEKATMRAARTLKAEGPEPRTTQS